MQRQLKKLPENWAMVNKAEKFWKLRGIIIKTNHGGLRLQIYSEDLRQWAVFTGAKTQQQITRSRNPIQRIWIYSSISYNSENFEYQNTQMHLQNEFWDLNLPPPKNHVELWIPFPLICLLNLKLWIKQAASSIVKKREHWTKYWNWQHFNRYIIFDICHQKIDQHTLWGTMFKNVKYATKVLNSKQTSTSI